MIFRVFSFLKPRLANTLQTSSYSFDSHSKSSQIRVLDVRNDKSYLISNDTSASDPIWIGKTEVAFVKSGDNGSSMLLSQDIHDKCSR